MLLYCSYSFDICGKRKDRDRAYTFVLFILILLAGLRWRVGGDTIRYLTSYYSSVPYIWEIRFENLTFGGHPLWDILVSLIRSLKMPFFAVQMFESAFVNILLFKYLKKHTEYIFTCVFFYFIGEYFFMNMETMKLSFCVVLCLYAHDFFIEKKWIKAYSLTFIAILFHAQSMIILLTPLFLALRINSIVVWGLMSLSFIFGIILPENVKEYLSLLEFIDDESINDKLTNYSTHSFYMSEESFRYKLLNTYPLIIYSFISAFYIKRHKMTKSLDYFQPFLILGIIFMVLQLNVHIFYRLVKFYKIYMFIFISHTFVSLIRENRFYNGMVETGTSYIRTFVLFIPLFISLLFYTTISDKRVKYYPYSSIFDKEISIPRERYVQNEDINRVSYPREDEY